MVAFAAIADVLGIPDDAPARSPFGLIERIETGLPVKALDRMARLLAPDDALFKYRFVPKATYERRKGAHRLSAEEGARLARVARVWGFACEVWGGEEAARAFLFRPHLMLEDRRPVDLALQGEIGAELVLDVLGGLKYGTAA